MAQGFKYALRGGAAMDWFGPSQPLQPAAPAEVKGRAWDFPTGTNLQTRPRGTEGVSFEQLRALADGYDLLRLAIETRKDQLCRVPWSIQPQQRPDQQMRDKPDQRCADLEAFLKFPDRRRPWARWLRTLAEDLFVLDAPSLYVRRSVGGDVYSLDVIDGATIRPLVGADGRSPLPPDPCFQQVLKGVPAVDYTADELIYLPFNPRSNRVYGYGQVEQVIRTVEIGIRRQIHQMQHYTEGNVPEALCGVPEEWSPDQIDQFQRYWDSLMEGNTAARRHMKFVPGKLAIQFTKDVALKDMFDEWLARVICYAFSLPPTAFVQQMNRATAQTAQEAALEEGLAPLMQWVKELLDFIIQKHFGYTDLEFVWKNEKELDPAVKNQLEIEKLKSGLLSFDEIRQADGKAPYGIGPIIFGVGPAGFVFIEDLKDPAKRAALMNPPPPALPGPGGEPPPGHPGAPPSPAPAPGPAISEAHHAAAAALHATVSSVPAPRPVAVETAPLNETHQAAAGRLHETLGVTPQQQAQDDGAHTPQIAEAMAALRETLGNRVSPFALEKGWDERKHPRDAAGRFVKASEFAIVARDNPQHASSHTYGTVSAKNADMVQAKIGIDISGYSRILDSNAVRHVFNRHGDEATERKRGQIAIEPKDFDAIERIVNAPDRIKASRTNRGLTSIVYEKLLGDYYTYVEEVRRGQKKVAVTSMWKRLATLKKLDLGEQVSFEGSSHTSESVTQAKTNIAYPRLIDNSLTKADGRAGRDGDGDGIYNEKGKISERAAAGRQAMERLAQRAAAMPADRRKDAVEVAAMHKEGIGPIDFRFGHAGTPERRFEDGGGIAHAWNRRMHVDKIDANAFIKTIPDIIARGQVATDWYEPKGKSGQRREINWRDSVVVIARNKNGGGNPWVLTAFKKLLKKDDENARLTDDPIADPHLSYAPDGIGLYHPHPLLKSFLLGSFPSPGAQTPPHQGGVGSIRWSLVGAGVEDNIAHNRQLHKSSPRILSIAEAAEAGIVQAFGNALLWWSRQGDQIGEDATTASSPDDVALPLDELERHLDTAFDQLRSVFRDAGEATVNDNLAAPPGGERIDFNFDLRNKRVTDFLDGYKMDLIRHITADQAEQVRAIVTDAATRGEPPATIARRVRDVVGLTPYQAGVVETYRAELERLDPAALSRVLRDARFDPTLNRALESGQALGDEQIDKMVAAYKRRFLDMRAMTIGRTESIRAANSGARMSVATMLDDPEMDGITVEKTWVATDDHRTRDSHRGMNGQTVVGLDTPFITPSGVQMSGPHDPEAPAEEVINCRCVARFRLVRSSSS
ncbi:phage portal protein (plasmid) [Azospirillum sp. HJ39]|uniref:phage portal protein n=1 Tax=Azospirillum sp. HJ39 TaxID=3159496 RepID=UPI00355808F8